MKETYYQTIFQIISTGHWITDRLNQEFKEHGATEPQFNVLRTLKAANGEPVTVQQLLEKMVQRSSNITRIVDKLVAKEFVERKECPTNRRKMDITITKAGLNFLKKLDKKVARFNKPLMKNLNEKELKTLKKLILKLKSNHNE
ncbi:MAG: MarR family winged helix-turn-helix transcriptional regulator [Saprospiraceae bacterium]